MRDLLLLCILACMLAWACGGETVEVPKPRSYPKVDLPEAGTPKTFRADYCDLTFEYPSYAQVERDTTFFEGKPAHDCWFDVDFPSLNGKIHCSYYPIETDTSFDKLMSDAFRLADEHNIRADYIDSYPLQKPNGVSGMVFDIDGPTASPFQFFLTDSSQHFLRGSVYVQAQSNPDSLRPIVEFLKRDAVKILNSFAFE